MWYLVTEWWCDDKSFWVKSKFITKDPSRYNTIPKSAIGYEYKYTIEKIKVK